jgi:hypothetical protein
MPLVRIDLRAGRSADFRRDLGDAVYRAMTEAANVPPGDRFVLITEHDASGMLYDPSYLGVARSDLYSGQITLNVGRSVISEALYHRIMALENLAFGRGRVRELVEVPKNWSRNGIAQYAE